MPSLTIALDQDKATSVIQNGWWNFSLPSAYDVPANCSVTCRLPAIDSKKIDDNTIVIPDDIAPTMVFSYYDVDYSDVDKEAMGGGAWNGGVPTYDKFLCYGIESYGTFTTAQIYIKNGYLPQNVGGTTCAGSFVVGSDYAKKGPEPVIAFVATLQYIDENGEYQTTDVTGGNVTYGIIPGAAGAAVDEPMYYSTGNSFTVRPVSGQSFNYIANTISILRVSGQYPGNNTYGAQNGNIYIGGSIPPTSPVQVANSVGRTLNVSTFGLENIAPGGNTPAPVNLIKRVAKLSFKTGTYDPGSFAVAITQQTDSAEGMYPPPDDAAVDQLVAPLNTFYALTTEVPDWRVRRLNFDDLTPVVAFDAADTYIYTKPTYMGAKHVTCLYNNTFAFSQLHTGLKGGAGVGDKAAIFEYTDGGVGKRYKYISAATGILIHDLQPADWWKSTLGLYDQVVIPLRKDNNGKFYISQTDIVGKTTEGFQTRDVFGLLAAGVYNIDTFRQVPTIFPVYTDVTGQTNAILGDTIIANPTGGIYIVEITGLPPKDGTIFVDGDGAHPNVQAVISTRYDTNDQITGDSTNGINYTSNAPSTQKDYSVRIMDQQTGLTPVLGPNNSFIFDLAW